MKAPLETCTTAALRMEGEFKQRAESNSSGDTTQLKNILEPQVTTKCCTGTMSFIEGTDISTGVSNNICATTSNTSSTGCSSEVAHHPINDRLQHFVCDLCSKLCFSRCGITKHVFTHMPNIPAPPHICEICGEVFSHSLLLAEHTLNQVGLMSCSRKAHIQSSNVDIHNQLMNVKALLHSASINVLDNPTRWMQLRELWLQYFERSHIINTDKQMAVLSAKSPTSNKQEQAEQVPRDNVLHAASDTTVTKSHVTNPTVDKPYICDICSKSYTQARALRRHKHCHGERQAHVCDICNKSFTQAYYLKQHRFSHTGETPYVCNMCPKAFSDPRTLRTHKLGHSGEDPFACDVCGKSLSDSSALKSHRRIHTGEKPFVCDICQKSFTQSCHLKQHKLTHTGERPHSCDVCQKQFRSVGALRNHRFTHTGERPYVCNICMGAFSQVGHLRKHRRAHFS